MKFRSKPKNEFLDALANAVVIGLARLGQLRIDTAVARRHAEVRRALEHCQVLGLLRDLRDCLHRGGARADDTDTLGGEIDAVMRPLAGVVALALERAEPLDRRHVGSRQCADRGNDEARPGDVALVGANRPKFGAVVEDDLDDALAELNVRL